MNEYVHIMGKLRLFSALCMTIVMQGCAFQADLTDSRDMRYGWTTTPRHEPLPPVVVDGVPYEEFLKRCRQWDWLTKEYRPAHGYGACAERRYDLGKCFIVTYYHGLDGYLKWHEEKHCLGYDH
jgi:hypothetical protein